MQRRHLTVDDGATTFCGIEVSHPVSSFDLGPRDWATCLRCIDKARYYNDPDDKQKLENGVLYVSPAIGGLARRHFIFPDKDKEYSNVRSVCGLAWVQNLLLSPADPDHVEDICQSCRTSPNIPKDFYDDFLAKKIHANRGGSRLPSGPTSRPIPER